MSNEAVPAGHEKPGTQLRFSTQSVRVKGVKSWARARYRRVVTGSIGIYGQSGHRWIRLPDEPCENIRVWSARHKRAVTLRLRKDATDGQRGDELSLLYARPEKGGDWQLIAVRNVTTNAVFELSQAELSSAVPDAALMPLHALGAACVGIIGAVLTGHGASEPGRVPGRGVRSHRSPRHSEVGYQPVGRQAAAGSSPSQSGARLSTLM